MGKMIEIPFEPQWATKMTSGIKTCTSRYEKYGEVGDRFTAFGQVFKLTKVESVYLGYVFANLYDAEGCKNSEQFYDVWMSIHPKRGFRYEDKVWVHHFKVMETDANSDNL